MISEPVFNLNGDLHRELFLYRIMNVFTNAVLKTVTKKIKK